MGSVTHVELTVADKSRCIDELRQYLSQAVDTSIEGKTDVAELQFYSFILKRSLNALAKKLHKCEISDQGFLWTPLKCETDVASLLVPVCSCGTGAGEDGLVQPSEFLGDEVASGSDAEVGTDKRSKKSTTKRVSSLTKRDAHDVSLDSVKKEVEAQQNNECGDKLAVTEPSPVKKKRGRPRKAKQIPPSRGKSQTLKRDIINEAASRETESPKSEDESEAASTLQLTEDCDSEYRSTKRRAITRKRETKKTEDDSAEEDNFYTNLNEPWICSWCSKEFKIGEKKDIHIRSHLYTPSVHGWKVSANEEKHCEKNVCDEENDPANSTKTKREKRWKRHSHLRSAVLQPNLLEELMQYIGTELDEEGRRVVLEETRCPLCETSFKTRSPLYKHLLEHRMEFRCTQCNKEYANRKRYVAHMREVHKPSRVPCPICNKVFISKNRLRSHMRCHDNNRERRHLCTLCGKSFLRQGHLLEHLRGVHQEGLPYKCEICDTKLGSKHNYKMHKINVHAADPPTSCLCPDCGKSFKTSGCLQAHIKQWHSGNRFKCSHCEETFETHLELYDHFRSHTDKNYICQRCGEGFDELTELTQHRVHAHFSQMRYQCSICGQGFQFENKLKRHMKIHSGEKIFCEMCNRAFTDSNRLKYHIRRVHQSGLVPCPICGKEIKSHALNHHMKVVHSDSRKKFKCKFCGMKFNTNYNLRRHTLTHTGEKPFQCEYCDKAYTQPHVLKSHHDAVHPGLPFNKSSKKTSDTQLQQVHNQTLAQTQDGPSQGQAEVVVETEIMNGENEAVRAVQEISDYSRVLPAAGTVGQQYVVSVFNPL